MTTAMTRRKAPKLPMKAVPMKAMRASHLLLKRGEIILKRDLGRNKKRIFQPRNLLQQRSHDLNPIGRARIEVICEEVTRRRLSGGILAKAAVQVNKVERRMQKSNRTANAAVTGHKTEKGRERGNVSGCETSTVPKGTGIGPDNKIERVRGNEKRSERRKGRKRRKRVRSRKAIEARIRGTRTQNVKEALWSTKRQKRKE